MARPIRLCQDKIPEAARLNRVQFETRRFQFRSSPPGRPWKVGTTGFKLDAVYHGLFFPSRFEHHFVRGIFFDGCTAEEISAWRDTFSYFLRKVALIQPGRPLLL